MSACPYCGGASRHHVLVFDEALYKCAVCRLIFVHPSPGQDEMVARHLSTAYAEHSYFVAGAAVAAAAGNPVHQLALEVLSAALPPTARVLDVGAGSGDFIAAAAARFPVVEGLEPSSPLAARARERSGRPVVESTLESFTPIACYDAVVMMDIIEHTADPRVALAAARRLLRPGGLLFICTVNSRSLLYAVGPLVALAGRFSSKARYLLERIYCYQHNWYFNPATLAGVVSEGGFELMRQGRYEFPLDRLRESAVVVLGLRMIYWLQGLLGVSTEQYLLARRPLELQE